MTYRYYFNPFTHPAVFYVSSDAVPGVSIPFDKWMTAKELHSFLKRLEKMNNCFAFDFFYKFGFISPSIKEKRYAESIPYLYKKVFLKTHTVCPKCANLEKCSSQRIAREKLVSVWDSIFIERGVNLPDIFKKKEVS